MDQNHIDILYSLYWSDCVTLGRKPHSKEEYIEEYTKQQSKKHVQSIEQAFHNRQALIKMDQEFLRYEAYLDECERLGILPGEKSNLF